jgi:hypothetical protein
MSVPIFQGVDGARLHSVVHANFTTSCRQVGGVLQSWLLPRGKRKKAFGAATQFDHRKHLLCTSLIGMKLVWNSSSTTATHQILSKTRGRQPTTLGILSTSPVF